MIIEICEKEVFNACVNILAVEYLIKQNNDELYGKYIKKLYYIFENHTKEQNKIEINFTLNNHIKNLGEMITQEDYEDLKRILLEILEKK